MGLFPQFFTKTAKNAEPNHRLRVRFRFLCLLPGKRPYFSTCRATTTMRPFWMDERSQVANINSFSP